MKLSVIKISKVLRIVLSGIILLLVNSVYTRVHDSSILFLNHGMMSFSLIKKSEFEVKDKKDFKFVKTANSQGPCMAVAETGSSLNVLKGYTDHLNSVKPRSVGSVCFTWSFKMNSNRYTQNQKIVFSGHANGPVFNSYMVSENSRPGKAESAFDADHLTPKFRIDSDAFGDDFVLPCKLVEMYEFADALTECETAGFRLDGFQNIENTNKSFVYLGETRINNYVGAEGLVYFLQ